MWKYLSYDTSSNFLLDVKVLTLVFTKQAEELGTSQWSFLNPKHMQKNRTFKLKDVYT